jgi:guanylate kinase
MELDEKVNGAEKTSGLLVVVSAPSGAGKTSVLGGVFARRSDLRYSVSVTTRTPREGEVEGKDYYFVREDEFDERVKKGEFVEWAVVHGNRYGTLKQTVEEGISRGGTVVFDTDVVGARAIKARYPEAVLIFIAPPSPEELRRRLMSRNTETMEKIRIRLEAAPHEMEHAGEYDYIVVNDTLENAVARCLAIIEAEHYRSGRMAGILKQWR